MIEKETRSVNNTGLFLCVNREKYRITTWYAPIMSTINWADIRNEYISTNMSYRDLAKKYDISFPTVQKRGTKEQWPKLRSQIDVKTVSKIIERSSERKVMRAITIDTVADMILQGIENDIRLLREAGVSVNWKIYTGALKDLKDIKSIPDDSNAELKIVFEGMGDWDK